MGWIRDEFQDRARARQAGPQSSGEEQFQMAAAQCWAELLAYLKADVEEYKAQGRRADFGQGSPTECRVANDDTGLQLWLRADLPSHAIHYSFASMEPRVAPPEGGIFSLRQSRWGRLHLYSSDQRLNSEAVRRMLLEPVLFATEPAA